LIYGRTAGNANEEVPPRRLSQLDARKVKDMRLPLIVAKRLQHGTTNPIVARLTLQTLEILQQCDVTKEKAEEIGSIYLDSLVKKLLRCWEIEQALSVEYDKMLASYKPPQRGAVSVELPQIPRLEEDCHNYLYEGKNFLRDLLGVFNLLFGTKFKEASEWARRPKGGDSVIEFSAKTFGDNHVNAVFSRQLPACISPFIDMRNAVEHPEGWSGQLKIRNFAFDVDGKITDPVWSREKDGKTAYGPLPIIAEMRVGVHNFLILGECVLIMWAQTHLSTPGLVNLAVVEEARRNPLCPVKWRVGPSAPFTTIVKAEATKVQAGAAPNA
jgi:hypothetical protein